MKTICVSFFLIFLSCFSSAIKAQTPEGKWHQVSTKQFLTEEGIKSYGRSFLETGGKDGTVIYTFLPDHTYQISSKSVSNPTSREFSGSWSLAGDQLTMTSNGKSVVSKMSMHADVLTLDTAYPNSDITTNVIVTFKKM